MNSFEFGDEWTAVADYCLEIGGLVLCDGFVLVPDTKIVEAFANDPDDPAPVPAATFERADGRRVLVYEAPDDFIAHVVAESCGE